MSFWRLLLTKLFCAALAIVVALAAPPTLADDRAAARGDGEDVRLPEGVELWEEPQPASPFAGSERAGDGARPPRLVAPVHYERAEHDHAHEPASETAPLKLTPRGENNDAQPRQAKGLGVGALPGSWKTMAGALAIVLALFFSLTWFAKKAQPKAAAKLPTEVIESLGHVTLPGRQQLHLLRLGDKLVLLSMTSGSVTPVAEVTDPDEVERLTGLCRQNQPGSFTNTFRRALAQFGDEPAPSGFLGQEAAAIRGTSRARR